jgi:hypothetical protein
MDQISSFRGRENTNLNFVTMDEANDDGAATAAAPSTATALTTPTPRVSRSRGPYNCPQLDSIDLALPMSLLESCAKFVIQAKVDNDGRLPQEFMTKLLLKLHGNPLSTGITRDHVNNKVRKLERESTPIPPVSTEDSDTST